VIPVAFDPIVAAIAILVVVITEIACRIAEAGALVDAALEDARVSDDAWWDEWAAENKRRTNGEHT
jgi:hypothetical protein